MTSSPDDWPISTTPGELTPSAVYVWRAVISSPAAAAPKLAPTLSDDERERANRLDAEELRDRFIVCRGIVRSILAGHLALNPASLRFQVGRHGKPSLADGEANGPVEFSISHSGGLLLVAVTCGRRVGVDVEQLRPVDAFDEIAARFFSPCEHAAIRALPPQQRQAAFFACWTRKESYLKATGDGLSQPLDRFDVSVAPDDPAALLAHRADALECARWSMVNLSLGPGYAGALTVEGRGWDLKLKSK
jgi:4'-phosphopantetheinyl transferase